MLSLKNIDDEFWYYAFSDQDDVWHTDKISNAIGVLEEYPDDLPVLYCGRTAITDKSCDVAMGYSPLFSKPPTFSNALVQSIGGGNTMVFNKIARDLIALSLDNLQNIEVGSHDWWCYQIISGAGSIVHYDPKPSLMYRQHSNNLIGSNNGWTARLIRIRDVFRDKFKKWNDINSMALASNRDLLTPKNQRRLDDFIAARKSSLIKRLFLFKRSGIYRQTFLGNIGLILGIFINKV